MIPEEHEQPNDKQKTNWRETTLGKSVLRMCNILNKLFEQIGGDYQGHKFTVVKKPMRGMWFDVCDNGGAFLENADMLELVIFFETSIKWHKLIKRSRQFTKEHGTVIRTEPCEVGDDKARFKLTVTHYDGRQLVKPMPVLTETFKRELTYAEAMRAIKNMAKLQVEAEIKLAMDEAKRSTMQ